MVLEGVVDLDLRPDISGPQATAPGMMVPTPLQELAAQCWHRSAAKRPAFEELRVLLAAALEQARPYGADAELVERIRAAKADLAAAPDEAAVAQVAAAALAAFLPGLQAVAAGLLATPAAAVTGAGHQADPPQPPHVIVCAPNAREDEGAIATNDALALLLSGAADAAAAAAARGPHPLSPQLQGGVHQQQLSSVSHLLLHPDPRQQHSVVTSCTAHGGAGVESFSDWRLLNARLPPLPLTDVRKAWSALLRPPGRASAADSVPSDHRAAALMASGGQDDAAGANAMPALQEDPPLGFLSVLWDVSTLRFAEASHELLLNEIASAAARALHRCRVQAAERERLRAADRQRLQQLFLQNMSHELCVHPPVSCARPVTRQQCDCALLLSDFLL